MAHQVRVKFTLRATQHLDNALQYIAQQSPQGAQATISRINRSIIRLGEFPFSGPLSDIEGCRELAVPQTSFIVYYRINLNVVEILGIFHGAQQRPDAF